MSRVLCNHATEQFVQGEQTKAKGDSSCMDWILYVLQCIGFCMCCSAPRTCQSQPVVTVLPLATPAEKTE